MFVFSRRSLALSDYSGGGTHVAADVLGVGVGPEAEAALDDQLVPVLPHLTLVRQY